MGNKLRFAFLDVRCCPFCDPADFKKDSTRNHKQRYRCRDCGRTFYSTTGTVFALAKKNEMRWRDFVLQMTNESTLFASQEFSDINTNTAMLWRRKFFACIPRMNESTVLSDEIWFDEIYVNISGKPVSIRKT